jgi:uncharacterized protein with FMN-binding domain
LQSARQTGPKIYTGNVAYTQYGPVQVRVSVKNGTVLRARAVQHPHAGANSAQINAYAIPILDREAVGATSATIDMVSGATYTSEGYLTSLQSALDQAGI